MSLTPSAYTFAQRFQQDTGLNQAVIYGWIMAETSGYKTTNGPNNWLNVGSFDDGFVDGGANVWDDPVTAADATASFMLAKPVHGSTSPVGPAASSIQDILSTVGSGVGAQVAAIQDSGWASAHYSYNLIADVSPFLGGQQVVVGPGPSGGIVRPGGSDSSGGGGSSSPTFVSLGGSSGSSGISSPTAGLLDTPRTAPASAEDVSLVGGIKNNVLGTFQWYSQETNSAWSSFKSLVDGPVDAFKEIGTVGDETVKILELLPWYMLRFSEFTTGITLMGIGLALSIRSGGHTATNSGPAAGIKTALSYTPIGRSMRIASATRAGTREGQVEHHRNTARRQARAVEANRMSQDDSSN